MNNVDYVVICANQGVNKCNLLVHPDPGLNLPVFGRLEVENSTVFLKVNCQMQQSQKGKGLPIVKNLTQRELHVIQML